MVNERLKASWERRLLKEHGPLWGGSDMLGTGTAVSFGKCGHLIFRDMRRRGRWEKCQVSQSFLSSVPQLTFNLLPPQTLCDTVERENFDEHPGTKITSGILRTTSGHEWGVHLFVCMQGCVYEPKAMRTRGE